MIVMAVRNQHDIDLRQGVEGDTGIVVTFRPRKGKRRGAFRPDGIDQNIEARSLDHPAGVPDEANPSLVPFDARGRGIGERTWRPFRPYCALPSSTELPAQDLAKRFRRYTVGIKENPAIEVIRDRSFAGTMHKGIGSKKGWPCKGQATPLGSRNRHSAA